VTTAIQNGMRSGEKDCGRPSATAVGVGMEVSISVGARAGVGIGVGAVREWASVSVRVGVWGESETLDYKL
jgi:hypothetical protein